MEIFTSTISWYRRNDKIDITIKSATEWKVFAPTWDMVMQWKKFKITDQEYTEQYYALMRARYREDPSKFYGLLSRDRIVLCCYCSAGTFCHRYLLVDILLKVAESLGIEAKYIGEI